MCADNGFSFKLPTNLFFFAKRDKFSAIFNSASRTAELTQFLVTLLLLLTSFYIPMPNIVWQYRERIAMNIL